MAHQQDDSRAKREAAQEAIDRATAVNGREDRRETGGRSQPDYAARGAQTRQTSGQQPRPDVRETRPSLKDQDASDLRDRQRGGDPANADLRPDGPEANAAMRRVWSEPGGEAYNYRNSQLGAGGEAIDHGELTEAETPPENIRRISDPSLSHHSTEPESDADRAADTLGQDEADKG